MELYSPKVKYASSLYLSPIFEILVQTFLNAVLSVDACLNLDGELWADVGVSWRPEEQLIQPDGSWGAPVLLQYTKKM